MNPHLSGIKPWADPLPSSLAEVWGSAPLPGLPGSDISAPCPPAGREFWGIGPHSPAPERASKPQHRAVTFDSRPLDLFLGCPHPHLPQPEPAGDMQVTMAIAHQILTWGPAGSTGEGQDLPQRDCWRGGGQGAWGALQRPWLLCGSGQAQAAIYNSAEWAQ